MKNADERGLSRHGILIWLSLILIVCAGGYFFRIVQKQGIPRIEKLADCAAAQLSPIFLAPAGATHFHLVLAGSTNFSGTVKVHEGSNLVQEFKFIDATAMQCNWLKSKGYSSARILNWTQRHLAFAEGSQVQFDVSFDGTPPTNATLWISYLQRYFDFKKDQREAQR